MTSHKKDLSGRIRELRKSLGMTQQEFAEKLQVSQPTVHKWEKGSWPEQDKLEQLAALAGVTTEDFSHIEEAGPAETTGVSSAPIVPIIGYALPGGRVHFVDDSAETVVPAQVYRKELAAVRLHKGFSNSVFEGWTAFYENSQQEDVETCLNRLSIVQKHNGQTYLGILRRPVHNHYSLQGLNGEFLDTLDIRWCAPVVYMLAP